MSSLTGQRFSGEEKKQIWIVGPGTNFATQLIKPNKLHIF